MQSAAASNAGTTDTESNAGTSKPDTDAQVKELVFICERLSAYHSIGRVYRALGLLVDESLKRILWRHQRELSDAGSGFDIAWWAPHAPEPLTLAHWLREGLQEAERNGTFPAQGSVLRILHPEPPLGPDERHVLGQIASLAQKDLTLDIMTPRLLAARGG
uniref:Uncharacterized protein n=1 Tax=Candidatus Kentrum sp. LFY TaxID=2126342 RepID=A0A450WZ29_9GAMM|nr:MAG: hypothetical protein BECKLFY1418C_GA0070996_111411 [Candidatus Kentron sp. LFY]